MRRVVSLRGALMVAMIALAWCALWGSVSFANVASGVLVGSAIVASGFGPPARGGLRLRPLVRFSGLVAADLIRSTFSVAREIVTRTDDTEEAIIAVEVPGETRSHLLLLIIAITVTPGTAVVDADPDTGTLYLHLLHADRRPETEAHVRELARLACAALPVPPDRAEATT